MCLCVLVCVSVCLCVLVCVLVYVSVCLWSLEVRGTGIDRSTGRERDVAQW